MSPERPAPPSGGLPAKPRRRKRVGSGSKLLTLMPQPVLPTGTAAPVGPPPRVTGTGRDRPLLGREAIAWAFRQADPHVAVCPPGHSGDLMQAFREHVAVAGGRTRLVSAESPRAALAAAMGAAVGGTRTVTALAANALAGLIDLLHAVAAMRLPLVVAVVDGPAGGMLDVRTNCTAATLAGGAAWVQLHAEAAQEAYDATIQAFRLAEDHDLRLPVMIRHDAPYAGHAAEQVRVLEDAEVQGFVGAFVPAVDVLDTDNPHAVGALASPDWTTAQAAQVAEAMLRVPRAVDEIGREFSDVAGRHHGVLHAYRMDDAEVAVVAMGSMCGPVRGVVDLLRLRGVSAGMVQLRLSRPFPAQALATALGGQHLRAVAVLDRSGEATSTPLWMQVTAARASAHGRRANVRPAIIGVVLGVGGREVTPPEVSGVFCELLDLARAKPPLIGDPVRFMDVAGRGPRTLQVTADAASDQVRP